MGSSYPTGLLAPVERKNSWQLSDAAGVVGPDGLQHFLNRSRWKSDELRDRLRSYVATALACPDGVLVVDETGFLKKGVKSAGVQRQYSGTAGRAENSPARSVPRLRCRCRARIDRPRAVPASSGRSARLAGCPTCWKCRSIQTVNDLDGRRRVDTLVGRAPADAWHRVSAGLGERGERVYDWAWATLPSFGDIPAGFARTLLARRSLDDPTDIAYYLCFHPATVTREQIVAVAGARRAVEECFQAAKDQCGLDHYQVRTWEPWYRHITLAMLAHAFLAVTAATDPKAHAGWVESQSPTSAVSWR